MLAAKSALAIRYDALGEDTNAEMGVENRAKLEARLRHLEDKGVRFVLKLFVSTLVSWHLQPPYYQSVYLFLVYFFF